MIASKIICDDTYSNKSWCVVGQGLFSLKEINQMEREMCGYLEWSLNVPPQELESFTNMVKSEFGHSSMVEKTVPVPAFPVPVPVPAIASLHDRSHPIRIMTSSSDSDSDPSSPSHSGTTSPASSSAPDTPPQSINSDSTVQVAGHSMPRGVLRAGMEPIAKAAPASGVGSQPFAFAAAAVW